MRFLFIFLHSHQLKHHRRVSLSWFFLFLLQGCGMERRRSTIKYMNELCIIGYILDYN
ncbi:hypothetical protein V6Z12_D12G190400 [Gossypium hirsutum]